MPKLVGLCGSLRSKSFNAMLLDAAIEVAPAGTLIERVSIKDVPLYDGDVEAASGIPAAVSLMKEKIAGGDGLILVTPEYNNSIPGVFKNAVDWASRPPADIGKVFAGRPVAIMGATPGPGGTGLAQAAWLPVLRTLQTLPWFGARMMVSGAGKVFDENGKLTDAKVRGQLETFIKGFSEFVAKVRS